MPLKELAAISRRYGGDPEYVLAGGGNTSYKDEMSLYIKASGFALATITEDEFVRVDRAKLSKIWTADYPSDKARREAKALEDLMAARFPGEEEKRPSVETLVHELFEEAYVVHVHPSLVNGLTCSEGGEETAKNLFGDRVLWIPFVDPGYVLARTVRRMRSAYIAARGKTPEIVLLENHGIFVADDSLDAIDAIYEDVFTTLKSAVRHDPDLTPVEGDAAGRNAITAELQRIFGNDTKINFLSNRELLRFLQSAGSFVPLSSAYTPDHIVYAGHEPAYVVPDDPTDVAVKSAVEAFRKRNDRDPKIVAVEKLGVFGIGQTDSSAQTAVTLFEDAVKVATYAESFGGHHFLSKEMIDFILGWEVEHYRSKIALVREDG